MRIGLVDSDVIAYRSSILCEETFEEDAIELSRQMHDSWMEAADADICVPCLTIGRSFRAGVWPDYKKNRKTKPRPRHLTAVVDYIKSMDNVVYQPNMEADDVIGVLHTVEHGLDSIVITIDKDLDQLPGLHCNPDKESRYVVSDDDADLYRWIQVLSGDPTDSYAGIPGIGPAKANNILMDVAYGDRERIVRQVYADKNLDDAYFNQMVVCATILQHKENQCTLSLPGLTEDGPLRTLLLSMTAFST